MNLRYWENKLLPMSGYLCEPVSLTMMAVGAAASIAGSAMSAHDASKAAGQAETVQRKQKAELVKSMNSQNASLDLQDKQNLSDTMVKMSDNNLQAAQNQGIIRAAAGESMLSGRSIDRIQQEVENQGIRANANLQQNYERDYSKLQIRKVQNYENTKAQIAGMAPVQMPNVGEEILGGAVKAVGAGAAGYQGAQNGGGWLGGLNGALGTAARQEGV